MIQELHPESDGLYDDVRAGLSAVQRKLPPKHFYDDAGALLFERITQLDEYYLTRTELSILHRCIGEIAEAIGPRARIVELGSGSGLKTRFLLRHLVEPASYTPIDISRTQLHQFAASLASEFPTLPVVPLHADYTREWQLPRSAGPTARNVAFFPGSTIGNLEADAALELLARVRDRCGPKGGLLIGTDLHKDRATLECAYNDAEGVTAEFSLNLLRRINRECGTDFDLAAFRHHAFYDEEHHRIEMRLVASRRSAVTLPARAGSGPALVFAFDPGDHITTEYSHKYTPEAFRRLAAGAGWGVEHVWTDERRWFSVWLLRAAS